MDGSAEIGERGAYEQFFDQILSCGVETLREGVFPLLNFLEDEVVGRFFEGQSTSEEVKGDTRESPHVGSSHPDHQFRASEVAQAPTVSQFRCGREVQARCSGQFQQTIQRVSVHSLSRTRLGGECSWHHGPTIRRGRRI